MSKTWTRNEKRAWDCGWDSFERGFTEQHCPDYQTTEEREKWLRGWRERRDNDAMINKPDPGLRRSEKQGDKHH